MNVLHLLLRWMLDLGVTATVAVTAAYGVFKLLGTKWIDTRFAQRLETFKHEQNQEIERLRFRINALMDRTTKLHQHEFEVLPEVWNKLDIAFAQVRSFTSRLTSYPDLEQMGPAQYAEFLATSAVPEWQKEELRRWDRGHRNERYQEIVFWHRLHTR